MEVQEAFINRELAAKNLERNLIKWHSAKKHNELTTDFIISAEDYALLLEGLEEGWIGEPIRKTEAGLFIVDDTINILN